MAKNCAYCGRFQGRFHSCPEKKRAKASPRLVPDRGTTANESYLSAPVASTPSYEDAYSAYQEQSNKKWYRVYDAHNNSLGMYENEQQAQMKAMAAGGWVREYEKKGEESLPRRVFGDGRSLTPSDGGKFDIPALSPIERPDTKFKVVGADGQIRGSFDDEYDAQRRAEEVGGTVDKYVLKPAYRYFNPKEHMSFWERLRDNGQAYKKAKKRR